MIVRKRWSGVLRDLVSGPVWFPVVVFAAHVIAARIFLAYELVPRLDVPMHLVGGVAIAFFFLSGLTSMERHRVVEPLDRLVLALLVFALTCAAAVFWEFAEYVSDHTIGTTAQHGLEDTLLDMLLGITGGLAFIGLGRIWRS